MTSIRFHPKQQGWDILTVSRATEVLGFVTQLPPQGPPTYLSEIWRRGGTPRSYKKAVYCKATCHSGRVGVGTCHLRLLTQLLLSF